MRKSINNFEIDAICNIVLSGPARMEDEMTRNRDSDVHATHVIWISTPRAKLCNCVLVIRCSNASEMVKMHTLSSLSSLSASSTISAVTSTSPMTPFPGLHVPSSCMHCLAAGGGKSRSQPIQRAAPYTQGHSYPYPYAYLLQNYSGHISAITATSIKIFCQLQTWKVLSLRHSVTSPTPLKFMNLQ